VPISRALATHADTDHAAAAEVGPGRHRGAVRPVRAGTRPPVTAAGYVTTSAPCSPWRCCRCWPGRVASWLVPGHPAVATVALSDQVARGRV